MQVRLGESGWRGYHYNTARQVISLPGSSLHKDRQSTQLPNGAPSQIRENPGMT